MSESNDVFERDGIQWKLGAFLEALDSWNNWCSAKIIDLEPASQKVLVHFYKWSHRYDTWYPMSSPCLRPVAGASNFQHDDSTSSTDNKSNSRTKKRTSNIRKKKLIPHQRESKPSVNEEVISKLPATNPTNSEIKPFHQKGDYVLSKWRNQLSYVATVTDYKQRDNHGNLCYQVQYLCDGVLEWVPANRLTGCSREEAMALMNTIPGASPPVQNKTKEEEVMYDQTTKRFTDRCRDRRRRQRESLEVSLNNSTGGDTSGWEYQKRRRTDSCMSGMSQSSVLTAGGASTTMGSPVSSVNAGLSQSQNSTVSEKFTDLKSPSPVTEFPSVNDIPDVEEKVEEFRAATPSRTSHDSSLPKCIIPNPKLRVNMPTSSALLSRCTLSYAGTRPRHKWRGANQSNTKLSTKSPFKKSKPPPLKTQLLHLNDPATTSHPSPIVADSLPATPSSLPPFTPLSPPHSAGIASTDCTSPVNLLRSSSVVQQACGTGVLQYACPYCKEKQEDRIFRKESLLRAHIKIYHSSSQQEGKSITQGKSSQNSSYTSSAKKAATLGKPSKLTQEKKGDLKFDFSTEDGSKIKSTGKDISPTVVAHSDLSKSQQPLATTASGSGTAQTTGFSIVHCDRCGSCQEYDTMIQCDVCFIWAHMQCYGLNEELEPPSYWECDACAGHNRHFRASCNFNWRYDWMKTGHFPDSDKQSRLDSAEGGNLAESSSKDAPSTRLVKEASGVLCLAKSLSQVSWSLNRQLAEWRSGLLPPPTPASHATGGQSQDNTDFDLLQLSLNDDELPHLLGVEATFGAQDGAGVVVGEHSLSSAGPGDPYNVNVSEAPGLDDIAELTHHLTGDDNTGGSHSCSNQGTSHPVTYSSSSLIPPQPCGLSADENVFDLPTADVLFPVSTDSNLPTNSAVSLLSFPPSEIDTSTVSKSIAGEMFSNIPAEQLHTSGDLLDTIQQLDDLPDYLTTVTESDTGIHVLPSTCSQDTHVATVHSVVGGSISAYPSTGHALDAVSVSVASMLPGVSSTRHLPPPPPIIDKELLEYQQELANQKASLSNWFEKLAELEFVAQKANDRIDKLLRRTPATATRGDNKAASSAEEEIDKVRKNLTLTLLKLRNENDKSTGKIPFKSGLKSGVKKSSATHLKSIW